jgi:hypothetical protein
MTTKKEGRGSQRHYCNNSQQFYCHISSSHSQRFLFLAAFCNFSNQPDRPMRAQQQPFIPLQQ